MTDWNVPALMWQAAFQMGLYALMWVLAGLLVREHRGAVAHWGLGMLLLAVGIWLVGARGEPRLWWAFNGSNILTVLGFAAMRRGTEEFLRAPSHDREQLAVLLPVLAVVAAVGPQPEWSSLRIVLTYAAQAFLLLRLVACIRGTLAREFGRVAVWGMAVPFALVGLMLAALSLRQLLLWGAPQELQRGTLANSSLTYVYLTGFAIFSFGFMTLLTQRLVATLRDAAVRDPLTGLFNRRAVTEALDREWARRRRSRMPLALLMIDIDHFKALNDSQGHRAGDLALVRLADLLRGHLRTQDTVGRIGGEEFLLLLPDTPAEAANALAERLRQQARHGGLGVTFSVGLAMARDDDADAQAAVARADAAMYRAKAAGRDRVELDA